MRPSQYSAHRCSLLSLPSLEKHQHRPDETTDCSCHHTGPSPPGYKEQEDGVFRGKNAIQNWAGQPRYSGRLPLTATVPPLGPLAQQLSQTSVAGPPAKATESKSSSSCDCFRVKTVLPCDSKQKGITSASLPPS